MTTQRAARGRQTQRSGGEVTLKNPEKAIGLLAKQKVYLDKHKHKAMKKLESGTTLNYTAGTLERMRPAKLQSLCNRWHLTPGGNGADPSVKPSAAEMRDALAELLLCEKLRTNEWMKKKSSMIVGEINARSDYAVMEAMAHMKRSLADDMDNAEEESLLAGMAELRGQGLEHLRVMDELANWHREYDAIVTNEEGLNDKPGEFGWAGVLERKAAARSKIREMFDATMSQVHEKKAMVNFSTEALRMAEHEHAELEFRNDSINRKVLIQPLGFRHARHRCRCCCYRWHLGLSPWQ